MNLTKLHAETKENKLRSDIFYSNANLVLKDFAILNKKNPTLLKGFQVELPQGNENFARCQYNDKLFVLTLEKENENISCMIKIPFDVDDLEKGFSEHKIYDFDNALSPELFQYKFSLCIERIYKDKFMDSIIENHSFQKGNLK